MIERTPWRWLDPSRWGCTLALLIVASLAMAALLTWQGAPLRTPSAPCGIVCFEFVWNVEQAQKLLGEWKPAGQMTARWNLILDYPFIVIYCATFSLAAALASRVFLPSVGVLGSWLVFVAGGLDVVENYALWQLLAGNLTPEWPLIAGWCALIKFVLLGLISVYLIGAGCAFVVARRRQRGPGQAG
ncbi:MAG TPA: hypothetical protein PKD86_06370 [Gemmatales bacterium]|nr:hypothetical protein [Gemmatales bacterium]HMP58961.1 hypothetical protein [Gemmatales bacterium]